MQASSSEQIAVESRKVAIRKSSLIERRRKLMSQLPDYAILLANGGPRARNFAGFDYPFRGSSHSIFFCGVLPPGAVALLEGGRTTVFLHRPTIDERIWERCDIDFDRLKDERGFHEVREIEELSAALAKRSGKKILTLPTPDVQTDSRIEELLGRKIDIGNTDRLLAEQTIAIRLIADDLKVSEIRRAEEVTVAAFKKAIAHTRAGMGEVEILAALEQEALRNRLRPAYEPIVTVHGEILHNHYRDGRLKNGDLLLVDFGAESEEGYSADITRTWPVSGTFTSRQRELYEVVRIAQERAFAKIRPGTRWREVHLASCRAIAEGLVALGVLKGSIDSIVEQGAPALFFPHGIGHLLGLDTHDMRDLGGLVSDPLKEERSSQFGLTNLRFDRELCPGMILTVEPGLYVIPELLRSERHCAPVREYLTHADPDATLKKLEGTRGIRIEDNILVTDNGYENLTVGLPKHPDELEKIIGKENG